MGGEAAVVDFGSGVGRVGPGVAGGSARRAGSVLINRHHGETSRNECFAALRPVAARRRKIIAIIGAPLCPKSRSGRVPPYAPVHWRAAPVEATGAENDRELLGMTPPGTAQAVVRPRGRRKHPTTPLIRLG